MAISKTYKLHNAIILNITRQNENVVAAPIKTSEIRKHQHQFKFDFVSVSRRFVVYKVHLENQPDIIQGLVAFRPQKEFLDCVNMEINDLINMA